MEQTTTTAGLWREGATFLLLCLIIWPLLSLAAIGLFGIGAWIRFAFGGSA